MAVLRYILLVDNEIVEDRHHRPLGENRRFLVDRHARRAIRVVHPENAPLRLSERRLEGAQSNEEPADGDKCTQVARHLSLPVRASRGFRPAYPACLTDLYPFGTGPSGVE